MADKNYLFILYFCMAVRQINSASIFPKDTSLIYLNCDSIKCPVGDKCPTDSFHPPIHEFNAQQNCCPPKSCTCKECPVSPSAEDFLKCGKDTVLLIHEKGTGTPGNCCDQYKCGKKPICVDRSKSVKYYPKRCITCNSCVAPPCMEEKACEVEIGHCLSDTMEGKKNGSKWTEENGCSTCSCVNAKKECKKPLCQASNCKNPERIEGQCCPVCPEDLNPLPINIYTEAFEKPTMNPIEAMTTIVSGPSTSDKSITSTMSTTIQQQEQQKLQTISTTANEPIESAISKDLHKTETTIVYLPTDAVSILIIEEKDEIPTTKIDMEEKSTTEESNDTTDAILMEKSSSTVGPISTANAILTEMPEKENENISYDISVDSLEDMITPSTTSYPVFSSSSSTEEEGMEDFSSSSTTDGPCTISISISMPVSTSSPDFPIPESTSQHKDLVTMDRTSRTVEESPSNEKLNKASDNNIINSIIKIAKILGIGIIIMIIVGVLYTLYKCCTKKNEMEEPEMLGKPDKQKQKKMENRIYTPVPSEHNLSQHTETSSLFFFQCGVESDKE
ncbi:uncharacterized protein LOC6645307 isoform X1 [Drosophila willistoni]|uniref:uncharacterized protein LOC6645307 isoform X1 n=1 Tax=Drosophila willistoni TaxID=7260 RepID=UPI000C26D4CF|nr:uncharacterized protein LOC6645307 isoform X1 [Drosophila willistoni]